MARPSGTFFTFIRTARANLPPSWSRKADFDSRRTPRRPGQGTSAYLDALARDVRLFGGRIVIRAFETRRDLASLDERAVVNCTGLGARAPVGDEELMSVKGQLSMLLPQPEVTYATSGGLRTQTPTPGIGIQMQPRADGIALGGSAERDVWSLEPNEAETRRIVEGHIELLASIRPPARSQRPAADAT